MENGQTSPPSSAVPRATPQVIFANWREALHLLKLGRGLKYLYAQAIEGYLDYCLRNGLGVADCGTTNNQHRTSNAEP